MTMFSIKSNGTSQRLSIRSRMSSLCMAKRLGIRLLSKSRLASSRRRPCLGGFDNSWGARNVLCRRQTMHIEWNWKRQSW